MSRDAKVGLVIIFSFAFLLGTILLHRFQLTAGDSTGALTEPVVSESDSESSLADGRSGYPLDETGLPASAVDAVPADTLPGRTQSSTTQFGNSGSGEPRTLRTPNQAKPPADLPASQSNGALISLTEAETYQQPAAFVETGSSIMRQGRSETGSLGGNTGSRDDTARQTSPLLEIRTPARETEHNRSITTEMAAEDSSADSSESATHNEATEFARTVAESDVATEKSTAGEPFTSPDRQFDTEPLTRSIPSHSAGQGDLMDDSDRIQQAEGKRQLDRDSPPPLPRYGESPQATIESVASRPGRAEPSPTLPPAGMSNRTMEEKGELTEQSVKTDNGSNATQKTYIVKEGDSFWTISAKQYGTGKYFRALEEFNRHRLAAYEGGKTILRPGTEIMLPHVSVLQSKSLSKSDKVAETAEAGRTALGSRRKLESSYDEDSKSSGSGRSGTLQSRGSLPGASRVYRVQDGDSLSKIAQRELGASKRWQEIYELNADRLEGQHVLKIGMELRLPPDRP